MTDEAARPQNSAGGSLDIRAVASMVGGGLALAYPVYLGLMFRTHDWILNAQGTRPGVTDFLEVWVAGRSALKGDAAAAYDPKLHHLAQVAVAGHEFHHYLWWHYPPLFLFVAAGLAMIPYTAAFIGWLSGTLALYGAAIAAIARSRSAGLLACATPAVFINAIGGQSGPLNAALIGAALLFVEERPIVSGIFLGLLTYKPQFGILFPLVLAATGRWRAFASASIAAVAGIAASWMVFGGASFAAFLHFMPLASHSILVRGDNGWYNLQSVYGLMRWLGFTNEAGWIVQAVCLTLAAATMILVWRRDLPFPLKAAALATASLLATPYLYIYDFTILIVAFAFLHRHRPFDLGELAGIVAVNICIGIFLFRPSPIGLVAAAITAILVARRLAHAAARPNPVSFQIAHA
jgi:arabinofuranan 3-O-arabinosyltransferase